MRGPPATDFGDGRDGDAPQPPADGDLVPSGPPHGHALAALAVEEINAAGGVLRRPIEIIAGDGGTSPAEAAKTAVRMLLQDKVEMVVESHDSAVNLGGEVVGEEYAPIGPGNKFDDAVTRIKTAEPDLVLITLIGGDNINRTFAGFRLDSSIKRLSLLLEDLTLQGIGAESTNGLYSSMSYLRPSTRLKTTASNNATLPDSVIPRHRCP